MQATAFAPATPGSAIRHHRRARELSQRELAAAVGKSQSWLGEIELDRLALRVDDLLDLAQALGVNAADLLPARPATGRRERPALEGAR